GDQLYGATREIDLRPLTSDYTTLIALHAWKLEFQHPVRYDTQVINAPLPSEWPKFAGQFLL
ncbi:MAG: RNA pseudouridine synthase, partial [Rubinisphaera sp.]|nr:RNA pseudouridine synthase [Rubinisphaera sp.]